MDCQRAQLAVSWESAAHPKAQKAQFYHWPRSLGQGLDKDRGRVDAEPHPALLAGPHHRRPKSRGCSVPGSAPGPAKAGTATALGSDPPCHGQSSSGVAGTEVQPDVCSVEEHTQAPGSQG